jgi:mycothiol maleylpyruvate isomerase-like protein
VADRMGDLLAELYETILVTVRHRADRDLARPTRTEWTVRELLFHQLLDAQRTLVALASPTDERPDVDSVSYWQPFFPDSEWNEPHATFVRVSASAYATGEGLVEHFALIAGGAGRAVGAADAGAHVQTQGHVITVADLTSTLVVEATVHLLDLTVHLAAAPTPPAAALAETRRVLEGLHGAALPTSWDDTEAALKGTGRIPLDDADRIELGAAWRPLLG